MEDFDLFLIEHLFDEEDDYSDDKNVSLVVDSIKNMTDAINCSEPNVWEWDVRHLPYVGYKPLDNLRDMETFDAFKLVSFFFVSIFSLCGNGLVVILMVRLVL
jgi:hypothetical protein